MSSWTPEVKRALLEADCRFVSAGKGDHEICLSPHSGLNFPVDQKIKSRHTANEIMKQAGLPHRFC
jgi:hypothetical protein